MTQTSKQKQNQNYYQKNRQRLIDASALYQKVNRDRVNEKNRKWVLDNPDKMQIINEKKQRKKRCTPFEKQLFHNAKNNAKKRGQEFNIILEDIVIPEYCPLLGIKLIKEEENYIFHHKALPSLDRVDSTKGYTKDNIWVISYLANKMKADASLEDLVSFSLGVLSCRESGAL